ncbi:MAG: hypothetical protein EHM70_13505 [Chloroflexota bacterium]|nr:MAG: hypothetical protein EHM70_13505 [Chloroflexota bacterium]
MSNALLAGTLWIIMVLAGYLVVPPLLLKYQIKVRRAWVVVVLVACLARLIPNFILPMGASYDIDSYQIVGRLVLHREDVYSSPDAEKRHPYLPAQMYWMAFAEQASSALGISFVKVVRLAPILADVAIALLLYWLLLSSSPPAVAMAGGLTYALNPVTIYVSAYHGQFDALPALFILLSLMMLDRYPLAAGGWLGMGILEKGWAVLALPSLLAGVSSWRKKALLLLASVGIPLLATAAYVAVFHANIRAVVMRALGYNWGVGIWGYTYFFRLLSILNEAAAPLFYSLSTYGRYLTLAALGLVWLFKARKESPAAGVLTVLVAFFALTHAFSIQYLIWLVPFAVLQKDFTWLRRYTLAAFLYMFIAYTTLILEFHIASILPWPQADWFLIMPAGLPAWIVTAGWAVHRLTATPKPETKKGKVYVR